MALRLGRKGVVLLLLLALAGALVACGQGDGRPQASIDSPREGDSVPLGSPVAVISRVSARDGVAQVVLSVNGQPYRFDVPPEPGATLLRITQEWRPEQEGAHTLQVTATAANGQVSSPVTVKVTVVAALGQLPGTPESGPEPARAPQQPASPEPGAASPEAEEAPEVEEEVVPEPGAELIEPAVAPEPTVAQAVSPASPVAPASAGAPGRGAVVQPADLIYLGAFRLPDDAAPPRTFEYGGNAMTFNPAGDPTNADPYPGSLFVTGHDRIAYGDLPDGDQVAEVSIPVPVIANNSAGLPQATFIQGFHNVTAGYFTQVEEMPKVGMQYLNHPATGPKIHLTWGGHLQPEDAPTHAWFNPTLATPDLRGVWFIGHQDGYSTSSYLFEIPASWADTYAQGRTLATGRMRDGGQGGMGPPLFAYRPWLPDGSAPPSGTHLQETTLLLYENAYNTLEFVRCLNGYQYPDEWEGGAWITTPSGKSAVLFAGTKSTGAKMWYGYINPRGPQYPCPDPHAADQMDICRMADGSSCPAEDYAGCCDEEQGTCVTHRGWWSSRFDAQFILYDPADLTRVAAGTMESWEPQPYASVDIDEHLFLDAPEWDLFATGWGDQRRNRIGPTAYDREHGLLYVLEGHAEGSKPVVHVWRVEG